MAYSKQTWIDDNAAYPVSAARMGVIEQGVFDAAATADQGHRILTTAQKTALGTVTTGTQVYDSTLGQQQYYTGSAWVPVGGLQWIKTSTFTGASSVSLDNVFSATYKTYKIGIILTGQTVATVLTSIRLRAGGVDLSTTTYSYAVYRYSGSNVAASDAVADTNTATGFAIGNTYSAGTMHEVTLTHPYNAVRKHFLVVGRSGYGGISQLTSIWGAGDQSGTGLYDGFTLYSSSGTLDGEIRVYGMVAS